jgi:hypothetical protein
LLPIATALLLAVAGLALRVWGAAWSLPYVDHPDEPAVVNVVLRIVEGKLDPNSFFYPSLMFYLQALVLKAHFVRGLRTGLYAAPLTLPETTDLYTTIPRAFVWGRVTTACLSALTIAAVGAWAGRYVGRRAALFAAALLLFSPWAIANAHLITVDAPAALFATLAILASLGVLARGAWRDYLLAGLLLGLASATKYQAVLVVLPLVVAHLLHWRRAALHQLGRLLGAGLAASAAFLLTSPFVVLDFPAFRRDITTLFASYNGQHGDVTGRWPVRAYAEFVWQEGLGPLPSLLALIGSVWLGRRKPALLLALLSFPLALTLVTLQARTHFFRNLLPAQPVLLILAGCGAVVVWDAARRFIPRPFRAPVAAVALAGVLLPSALPALRRSADFARPDSRVAAQEMLRREWPGVRVAAELAHPLAFGGVSQATFVQRLPAHTVDWYRQQGFGLLLANSSARRSYAWTPEYQPLLHGGQSDATYGRPGDGYRGPRIDIIQTGLSPGTIPTHAPRARLGALDLLGVTTGRLQLTEHGPEVALDRQAKAGDILAITSFWTASTPPPPANYTIFLHLRDPNGQNLAQRDVPPWLGLFPPPVWRPGALVADRLDLPLPPNLPPGAYRLVMGLYDSATQQRFPASVAGARLPGDEVDLGQIEIRP